MAYFRRRNLLPFLCVDCCIHMLLGGNQSLQEACHIWGECFRIVRVQFEYSEQTSSLRWFRGSKRPKIQPISQTEPPTQVVYKIGE